MTIFNYTVNYVDVAIIGILLLALLVGYSKGIIITIINFIRYSFGLFLCMFVSDRYTQVFYENCVKEKIVNKLSEQVVTSSNIDEIINNLTSSVDKLPSLIKNNVDLSSFTVSAHSDIANSIADNVFEPVALVAVKILLFLLTFIVFFGLTGLILHLLRRRSNKKQKEKGKKSGLKTIDKIFGGIFGLLKGALIVFVFVSLFEVLLDFNIFKDNAIMNEVTSSSLYNLLLNINPFDIIVNDIL